MHEPPPSGGAALCIYPKYCIHFTDKRRLPQTGLCVSLSFSRVCSRLVDQFVFGTVFYMTLEVVWVYSLYWTAARVQLPNDLCVVREGFHADIL